MTKWIPDSHMDLILDEILKSDVEVVLSAQPTTFYNAIWPDLWIQSTAYVVGDLVHPPTTNNFIYECTVGGTSGATEPGWATVQDSTFTDNGVTWKAHENYSLASYELGAGAITKEDGDISGRTITVPQVIGVVTHESGTVTHAALIEKDAQVLHLVTEAVTTIPENNDVVSGRTTIFFEFKANIKVNQ